MCARARGGASTRAAPTELDWLLDLADSSVTYRSRYLAAPEWLPVLDMLVRDEANPRSLAFQVKGLAEYVAKLERRTAASPATCWPRLQALRAARPKICDPESAALAALLDAAAARRTRLRTN